MGASSCQSNRGATEEQLKKDKQGLEMREQRKRADGVLRELHAGFAADLACSVEQASPLRIHSPTSDANV